MSEPSARRRWRREHYAFLGPPRLILPTYYEWMRGGREEPRSRRSRWFDIARENKNPRAWAGKKKSPPPRYKNARMSVSVLDQPTPTPTPTPTTHITMSAGQKSIVNREVKRGGGGPFSLNPECGHVPALRRTRARPPLPPRLLLPLHKGRSTKLTTKPRG